jgi:hypothetical protein
MCSPGIANPKRKPLIIVHGGSKQAYERFEAWLGEGLIQRTTARDFERLCSLFVATAVHCEVLRRISASLQPKLTAREAAFATATLLEAQGLLEYFDHDFAEAYAACLTPRGRTILTVQQFIDRCRD